MGLLSCILSKYNSPHGVFVWCLLWCLLGAAVVLNSWFMFLPRNTISDEEQYITQVLSLANGTPTGWNIRSFFFPLFLTPSAFIASLFESASWSDRILFVRLANWVAAWCAIGFTAMLARNLFGKRTGMLSGVLLLMLSPWLVNSTRVMMDMPAAMWLLIASFFASRDLRDKFNVILAVWFASAAVFTKFQAAPAALGIGLAIAILSSNIRLGIRNSMITLLVAAGMITFYAVIDWVTWGAPFASFFNFIDYNFASREDFQQKYGSSDPPTFYLTNIHNDYSYIFPMLVGIGLLAALRVRSVVVMLLPFLFYGLAIHGIGHKQLRYLLLVTPYMAILAAYSLTLLWGFGDKLIAASKNRIITTLASVIFILGFGSILLLLSYSVIPWNTLRAASGVDEACVEFVENVVKPGGQIVEGSSVLLAVPCTVPSFLLPEGFEFVEATSGFDAETRVVALELAKDRFKNADFALMALDSPIFAHFLELGFADKAVRVRSSQRGEYALFQLFEDAVPSFDARTVAPR